MQSRAGGFERTKRIGRQLRDIASSPRGVGLALTGRESSADAALCMLKTVDLYEELQRFNDGPHFIGSGSVIVGQHLMQWATADQNGALSADRQALRKSWCQGDSGGLIRIGSRIWQTARSKRRLFSHQRDKRSRPRRRNMRTGDSSYAEPMPKTRPDRGISYLHGIELKTPGNQRPPHVSSRWFKIERRHWFNEVFRRREHAEKFSGRRTEQRMASRDSDRLMFERGLGGAASP